jgi:hypothetical protein
MMLYAFTMDYRNHTSLVVRRYIRLNDGTIKDVFEVEIHGPSRLQIAVAVLNNYAMKLQMLEGSPAVVVETGRDEERLFKALQKLQELASPVKQDADFQDLLKNPTVERLEAFLAVKKLLEEKRTS